MNTKAAVLTALISFASASYADITVPMKLLGDDGKTTSIGSVTLSESPYGVLITPSLKSTSLTPGMHGFHLHVNTSCDMKGKAAGGHFDPAKTNVHLGPYQDGHLGDLPAL